ncbi:unnamed protein product [Paramecium pentaurelia]|uniref:Uncharacterized protein n=1 Tax=Paramecium pentaurelia TaxID=43138 RepID=A0A8S1XTJ6_9CILI|nr:unnamed protein product [Paramecium pentaurelia]
MNSRCNYNQPFENGCGLQNEQEGFKQGQLIELSYSFYSDCQIYFKEEYKKDKKISRWNILYKCNYPSFQSIGDGTCDQNGLKNGILVELSINFWKQHNQYPFLFKKWEIIYTGEYKRGIKQVDGIQFIVVSKFIDIILQLVVWSSHLQILVSTRSVEGCSSYESLNLTLFSNSS